MNIPVDILNRDKYISQIQPFIRKNLIKVLTGQRRVGKSYLVFQIINNILGQDKSANIIYINKEDLQFDFIQNANDLNDYIKSKT
jgi:predicted AAA+ superfamily ATPase